MANDDVDRSKVTFEQAEGFEPLPLRMALQFLSEEARAILWKHVYESLLQDRRHVDMVGYLLIGRWKEILRDYFVYRMNKPVNRFNNDFNHHIQFLEELFIDGEYQKVLGFIQYAVQHSKRPWQLDVKIRRALKDVGAAYTLVLETATIVPVASEEEGKAIEAALEATNVANMKGASIHLMNACGKLNEEEYANSVRESVHAVVSVARKLDPDESKTFSPALKALEAEKALHPRLRVAMEKLYAYSNVEEGIRHPLLDDPDKVGSHEAVFMLGVCASCVTYLINSGRDAGLLEE